MKKFRIHTVWSLSIALAFGACHDLDELNINPNGPAPETTDLNLLMPTFITQVGQQVVSLGFGDLAGVVQHTQLDGWASGHNDYDWNSSGHSWAGYYGILRQVNEFERKAIESELEFHQGVALVMKAYTFGMIADLWGDAPYSQALKAEDGPDFFAPVFDPQREIYMGILDDLTKANDLLSKAPSAYTNINPSQDVLFGGDVTKWRRFANSLALRYYMRLSAKEAGIAEDGISRITSNPALYPLITTASQDANVSYAGSSPADSWPTNMVFDPDPSGNYMRRKMCSTLVETLQDLNDPRLGVWAKKVGVPLVLVGGSGIDRIVDGKREISQDVVDQYETTWGLLPDFDPEYVGIPPSVSSVPQAYNLNPNPAQGVYNQHVSHLADMYRQAAGPLLLMRLMSAAEVHFILAEAALYGWASGDPADHYANGIRESFNAWGVSGAFDDYIGGAPYNGLESIITQKWIASWSAAAEAWFDWRRTGLPNLEAGPAAFRSKLPLRFYYNFEDEIAKNTANAEAAIGRLEPTPYIGSDTRNSAWSKPWLLVGTGKPY